MFKALKNPFSTPVDPKLTFRAHQLPRLYSETISADDDAYWALFFTLFESSYDAVNLLPGSDINNILQSHPENIGTLIHALCDRAEDIQQDPSFPTPLETASFGQGLAASLRPSFIAAGANTSSKPDLSKELLSCFRVLSRVVPFVLGHEDRSLEEKIFWDTAKGVARQSRNAVAQEPTHFVIDDEEEEDEVGNESDKPTSSTQEGNLAKPLAERLMDLCVDCLFTQGFTLPPQSTSSFGQTKSKVSFTIWENGIGSTVSLPVNRDIDLNRIEVLRLLLTFLSKTLYISSNAYTASVNLADPYPSSTAPSLPVLNKWHAYLVRQPATPRQRKATLSLLCSLLNLSLKSGAAQAASANTLMTAMGDAVGDSYEKLISGGKRKVDSPRLALVKICIQVLNALLATPTSDIFSQAIQTEQNRRIAGERDPTANLRSPPLSPQINRSSSHATVNKLASASETNAFAFFLSKLHRESDLGFIVENLLVLLLHPMNTSLLKLPLEAVGMASSTSSSLQSDILILLWKLVEINPKFVSHLLRSEQNVHQVLTALVLCCLDFKDQTSNLNLVKLAAFLLQTLSADKLLGLALNTPLSKSVPLPAKYAVPGTALDFLVQHLYSLIFTTKGALNAIYPAFILTIDNVSPYMRNPSIKTSTRLLQLFLAISNPGFLLSDEANPRLIFYLLEAFNNVVRYQLTQCPNLIYAIIRSHARFEELANFTLAGGVATIRKKRKERMAGSASLDPLKTPHRLSMSVESTLAPVPTPAVESEFSEQVAQRIQDQEKAALARHDSIRDGPDSQTLSPVSEYPPTFPPSRPLSEKAAGKQRARSMSQGSYPPGSHNASRTDLTSLYGDDGGDAEEGPFIAKSGFMPTESWVASWREGLPVDGILILVSECLTKISSLSSLSPGTNSAAIEKYLRSINLDGLLPAPPLFKPRPFQTSSLHSLLWLMSVAWGSVYIQTLENTGINNGLSNWRDTNIRLFNVRHGVGGGLAGGVGQVQAAVSSLVEQGLGMLNLGGSAQETNSLSRSRRSGGGSTPRRSMSRNSFGIV